MLVFFAPKALPHSKAWGSAPRLSPAQTISAESAIHVVAKRTLVYSRLQRSPGWISVSWGGAPGWVVGAPLAQDRQPIAMPINIDKFAKRMLSMIWKRD